MSDFKLAQHPEFRGISGQLVLLILDGVGFYRGHNEGYDGNAFDLAKTPNLDRLIDEAPVSLRLKAHGTAVGLPSDADMGNSEVGHNAMGAGRVFNQGAQLINEAIATRRIFDGPAWRELVENVIRRESTFHLLGLLSDGYVHSHLDHLEVLLKELVDEGVQRIRIHALADGRDVAPVSFHLYLERLELILETARRRGVDALVASGGGRMQITMDRYEADWEMVRRGWSTHVLGEGRPFKNPEQAVSILRRENPGIIDQDLPPFVVVDEENKAVGPIVDGDSVVFFNYRGDRAIEISRAFTEKKFAEFDRGEIPDVLFAGMMEYDGDLKIPPRYLVSPPAIDRTVSEYLVHNGVTQLATAETQKFGHVTYFWNGNNSEQFDPEFEDWVEVPSDVVPFETRPEMKAREVCALVVEDLENRRHKFIRANFANGDMVGHTGDLKAAIRAIEVVDACVGEIETAAREAGATLIVTADHGNLDMMWEVDKKSGEVKLDGAGNPVIKTSHTLSPVPWLIVGQGADGFLPNLEVKTPGLGNVASTILLMLGFGHPEAYLPSLIIPRPQ